MRCRRSAAPRATPAAEIVWLSDGVDIGGGQRIRRGAWAQPDRDPELTVIKGGLAPPRGAESRQHGRRAHVKVALRAGVRRTGTVRG